MAKYLGESGLKKLIELIKSAIPSTAADIGAAAASHTHAAGDVNSGTLASARLPTVPISKGGTGATTAAEALAALGGFGYVRQLTAADDMDTLTQPGVYYYATGNVPANAPVPNTAIVVVLGVKDPAHCCFQLVSRLAASGQYWIRNRDSSASASWLSWMQLLASPLATSFYGSRLPATSTKGQIFFKKVT